MNRKQILMLSAIALGALAYMFGPGPPEHSAQIREEHVSPITKDSSIEQIHAQSITKAAMLRDAAFLFDAIEAIHAKNPTADAASAAASGKFRVIAIQGCISGDEWGAPCHAQTRTPGVKCGASVLRAHLQYYAQRIEKDPPPIASSEDYVAALREYAFMFNRALYRQDAFPSRDICTLTE